MSSTNNQAYPPSPGMPPAPTGLDIHLDALAHLDTRIARLLDRLDRVSSPPAQSLNNAAEPLSNNAIRRATQIVESLTRVVDEALERLDV